MRSIEIACSMLLACSIASCTGHIGDEGTKPPITGAAADEIAVAGMRRLSVEEYRSTVYDLLGLTPEHAREVLPVDTLAPFDNDYTMQTASEALIKGAEMLAGDIAEAVVADPVLRVQVTGCEPEGASDDACFREFVERFGRRALRRPLSPAELDAFAGLSAFGEEEGDFWVGVDAALRAFLQHPAFLYRVEIGQPVEDPALHALDGYEVGTRLAYFLIGTTPPDWLLDAAAAGDLDTPEGVVAAAKKLFSDSRARGRMTRFHSMWLSYSQLTDDGLSGQMLAETEALLGRVIFDEKAPWVDVLTADQTFLTPELAEHYGLPSPGAEPGWVNLPADSGRRGLLSQGTFLSAVSKFGDTSPTQRGLLVRTRLFCETIQKPAPELKVNVDMPPSTSDPDACKKDRYYMSKDPSCAGCHTLMDPIGFGLEAFDSSGRFRDHEPERPDCPIDGEGEFVGEGTFNGPAELAELAVDTGKVEACVAQQLYRFAVGRSALDAHDEAILARVVEASTSGDGLRLDSFITEYVASDAFRFRREEEIK